MMVENSSYWDKIVNGGANDEDFENILSILDFPMESLEGDGLYGDLDSSSQCFGPLPWDQPKYVSPVNPPEINTTPEMKPWSTPRFEDHATPTIRNQIKSGETQELRQIPVPMVENSTRKGLIREPDDVIIPRRTRSKLRRSNSSTPWYLKRPISFTTTGINKEAKRKKSSMETINKKCTHCQVTKTPQWREGPLGPKTLCNACGVRYRSGRLFPEYRPAASPTFVPTLHSNSHRKVVEMRHKGKQLVADLGCFQYAN